MTTVNSEIKYVRNLGNYESVHMTVGITDTVREGETVNQAFERVYSFVESKLTEKVEAIETDLKSN